MRTYLNRIGFIGEEFANCREHLTTHLDGSGMAISGGLNCLESNTQEGGYRK
jgi:hypothetical protein